MGGIERTGGSSGFQFAYQGLQALCKPFGLAAHLLFAAGEGEASLAARGTLFVSGVCVEGAELVVALTLDGLLDLHLV